MKRILCFFVIFLIAFVTYAQSDARISYQSVVRDENNYLVTNSSIAVRISIYNNGTTTPAFQERHVVTSNQNGLISLIIGNGGLIFGSLDNIQWNNAEIKVEYDLNGHTNYTLSNTHPIMAVPYSLYADNVNLSVIQQFLTENNYVDSLTVVNYIYNNISDSLERYTTTVVAPTAHDTANILRDEWRGDIHDSLSAQLNNYLDSAQLINAISDSLNSYWDSSITINFVNDTLSIYWDSSRTINFINDTLSAYWDTTRIKDYVSASWVQSDWAIVDPNHKAFIKNKPSIRDSLETFLDVNHYIDSAGVISVINDTLGYYYTKDSTRKVISDTASTLRGYISASNTNIHAIRDSLSRIYGDVKADSLLFAGKIARLSDDSLALANKIDTLSRHLNDTLNNYYTKDSTREVISDTATILRGYISASNTNIHAIRDSLSRIYGDVKADSLLFAGKIERLSDDSLALANKIDTLSRHLNDTLNNYYTKDSTREVISDTATILRGYISASNTNIHAIRDSLSRIYGDVKADSLLFAGKIERLSDDSLALANKIDTLSRHLNDTLNNYYTKDSTREVISDTATILRGYISASNTNIHAIRDSLSRIYGDVKADSLLFAGKIERLSDDSLALANKIDTLSRHLNDTLNNYYTKDSTREVISDTATILRGYISASNTNIHAIRDSLSRIYGDVKTDSLLFAGKIERLSDDSLALANKIDTLSRHLNDTLNNYYTKDSTREVISDTATILRGYISASNTNIHAIRDSLSRIYGDVKADSLLFAGKIERLSDDSLALANKIDTLSRHLNDTLNNYYTKDSTREVISDTATILRGYISASNTNIHAIRDSLSRIYGDVKADSLLFAGKIERLSDDSLALANKIDTLSRHLNDTLNNYYTKDSTREVISDTATILRGYISASNTNIHAIRDSLSRIYGDVKTDSLLFAGKIARLSDDSLALANKIDTLSRHLNDTLNNYYTKDSTREVISDTATILRGYISASNTNIHAIRDSLSRIYGDVKADSLLFAGKIARLSDDSLALANKIDTLSRHLNDTLNNYYTKDSTREVISDTATILRGYISASNTNIHAIRDSLSRIYGDVKTDSLLFAGKIARLSDDSLALANKIDTLSRHLNDTLNNYYTKDSTREVISDTATILRGYISASNTNIHAIRDSLSRIYGDVKADSLLFAGKIERLSDDSLALANKIDTLSRHLNDTLNNYYTKDSTREVISDTATILRGYISASNTNIHAIRDSLSRIYGDVKTDSLLFAGKIARLSDDSLALANKIDTLSRHLNDTLNNYYTKDSTREVISDTATILRGYISASNTNIHAIRDSLSRIYGDVKADSLLFAGKIERLSDDSLALANKIDTLSRHLNDTLNNYYTKDSTREVISDTATILRGYISASNTNIHAIRDSLSRIYGDVKADSLLFAGKIARLSDDSLALANKIDTLSRHLNDTLNNYYTKDSTREVISDTATILRGYISASNTNIHAIRDSLSRIYGDVKTDSLLFAGKIARLSDDSLALANKIDTLSRHLNDTLNNYYTKDSTREVISDTATILRGYISASNTNIHAIRDSLSRIYGDVKADSLLFAGKIERLSDDSLALANKIDTLSRHLNDTLNNYYTKDSTREVISDTATILRGYISASNTNIHAIRDSLSRIYGDVKTDSLLFAGKIERLSDDSLALANKIDTLSRHLNDTLNNYYTKDSTREVISDTATILRGYISASNTNIHAIRDSLSRIYGDVKADSLLFAGKIARLSDDSLALANKIDTLSRHLNDTLNNYYTKDSTREVISDTATILRGYISASNTNIHAIRDSLSRIYGDVKTDSLLFAGKIARLSDDSLALANKIDTLSRHLNDTLNNYYTKDSTREVISDTATILRGYISASNTNIHAIRDSLSRIYGDVKADSLLFAGKIERLSDDSLALANKIDTLSRHLNDTLNNYYTKDSTREVISDTATILRGYISASNTNIHAIRDSLSRIYGDVKTDSLLFAGKIARLSDDSLALANKIDTLSRHLNDTLNNYYTKDSTREVISDTATILRGYISASNTNIHAIRDSLSRIYGDVKADSLLFAGKIERLSDDSLALANKIDTLSRHLNDTLNNYYTKDSTREVISDTATILRGYISASNTNIHAIRDSLSRIYGDVKTDSLLFAGKIERLSDDSLALANKIDTLSRHLNDTLNNYYTKDSTREVISDTATILRGYISASNTNIHAIRDSLSRIYGDVKADSLLFAGKIERLSDDSLALANKIDTLSRHLNDTLNNYYTKDSTREVISDTATILRGYISASNTNIHAIRDSLSRIYGDVKTDSLLFAGKIARLSDDSLALANKIDTLSRHLNDTLNNYYTKDSTREVISDTATILRGYISASNTNIHAIRDSLSRIYGDVKADSLLFAGKIARLSDDSLALANKIDTLSRHLNDTLNNYYTKDSTREVISDTATILRGYISASNTNIHAIRDSLSRIYGDVKADSLLFAGKIARLSDDSLALANKIDTLSRHLNDTLNNYYTKDSTREVISDTATILRGYISASNTNIHAIRDSLSRIYGDVKADSLLFAGKIARLSDDSLALANKIDTLSRHLNDTLNNYYTKDSTREVISDTATILRGYISASNTNIHAIRDSLSRIYGDVKADSLLFAGKIERLSDDSLALANKIDTLSRHLNDTLNNYYTKDSTREVISDTATILRGYISASNTNIHAIRDSLSRIYGDVKTDSLLFAGKIARLSDDSLALANKIDTLSRHLNDTLNNYYTKDSTREVISDTATILRGYISASNTNIHAIRDSLSRIYGDVKTDSLLFAGKIERLSDDSLALANKIDTLSRHLNDTLNNYYTKDSTREVISDTATILRGYISASNTNIHAIRDSLSRIYGDVKTDSLLFAGKIERLSDDSLALANKIDTLSRHLNDTLNNYYTKDSTREVISDTATILRGYISASNTNIHAIRDSLSRIYGDVKADSLLFAGKIERLSDDSLALANKIDTLSRHLNDTLNNYYTKDSTREVISDTATILRGYISASNTNIHAIRDSLSRIYGDVKADSLLFAGKIERLSDDSLALANKIDTLSRHLNDTLNNYYTKDSTREVISDTATILRGYISASNTNIHAIRDSLSRIYGDVKADSLLFAGKIERLSDDSLALANKIDTLSRHLNDTLNNYYTKDSTREVISDTATILRGYISASNTNIHAIRDSLSRIYGDVKADSLLFAGKIERLSDDSLALANKIDTLSRHLNDTLNNYYTKDSTREVISDTATILRGYISASNTNIHAIRDSLSRIYGDVKADSLLFAGKIERLSDDSLALANKIDTLSRHLNDTLNNYYTKDSTREVISDTATILRGYISASNTNIHAIRDSLSRIYGDVKADSLLFAGKIERLSDDSLALANKIDTLSRHLNDTLNNYYTKDSTREVISDTATILRGYISASNTNIHAIRDSLSRIYGDVKADSLLFAGKIERLSDDSLALANKIDTLSRHLNDTLNNYYTKDSTREVISDTATILRGYISASNTNIHAIRDSLSRIYGDVKADSLLFAGKIERLSDDSLALANKIDTLSRHLNDTLNNYYTKDSTREVISDTATILRGYISASNTNIHAIRDSLSRIYGDVKTDSLLFAGKIARLSDDSLALANKIDTLSRHLNDTLNNYYTKDSTREVISDTATILRGYISASNTNIHAIRDSLSRIYGDVKADSLLFAGKIARLSDDSLALANKIDTLSRHLNDTLNNYYTKDSTREVISDTATILRGYISASNTNIHAIRDSLSRIYGDVKADSLLFAGKIEGLSDDNLALSGRINTLSGHLNDTLNNYYTKDSTREVISDTATILRGYISASNTNIHAIRDSLSRIYGDVKTDSLLFAGKIARLSDDSLALANKINTLSGHLNDTLNNYYTKDSTREVISDTATILRGYISASNTNINAIRDSLSRIYGDVKTDSLLFAGKIARLSDDSLALANKIDTLSRHLNDTLNNYYTKDSTREVISDTATILRGYISASNTNIHAIRDSLSRIYGDVKADSLLFAGKIERLSDDSLALANKIDTLSRHLNDTLNNYYTKDSTREVISDTATILRGYISASNTNIHAIRDSLSRIYGDVKTDSLLFAGKIERLSDDSLALANKIDTLSRHLNDTLNNYYTKDSTREVISDTATILRGYISASNTNIHAIRDSLSRIYGDVKADSLLFAGKIERLSDDSLALANKIDTLSRHLNDTLNNYYTKDSTREVISDTATILRGYISASNTNIHAIRDSLSRIYGDVKTDSLLFAGKIARLSDDSLALANKIDTLSRHLNDTLNNYYTKDSTREVISDTATILRGYISASNTNIHAIRDSLSRIYGDVKADSLLFAGKIARLSDDSLALANKIDTLSRHLNDTLNNYYTKDSTREVISDTATILRGYISASNTNIHAIRDSLSRIYGDVKADSLLFAGKIARLSDDSLALANKIDTLSRHLNDTLNNYYTKDSTREVISDTATILRGYISASNTNIHAIRDSLSRIYGDVKADSLLFAGKIERLSDDSLALANKIDTLSRHLNDTLNNYYTKDSTREVISDTATILRGYISASNTNIHAIRDSLSRIYGDVKTDSLLFAGKIARLSDDSLALANKIDTLSRHLNDTLNNYYTKDSTREVISDTATILRGYISASNTNIHAIRDSLSRIYGDVKADSLLFAGKIERLSDDSLALANKIDTLSRHLNDTLNNYYTKDSTREVISDTATILRGYISASNTNIHAIRDSLSRIYGDVKTDSLLFAGKIARLSDDSLALANKIDTLSRHLNDTLNNYYTKDSTREVISDTATILRGYISASNTNIHAIRDSLSRIYGDVKADSLLFAGKIERLSDDSLALANKIDTLSRHLNDTLNNYYTKDSTREVISDTATILRGYISASNTNIHAIRDSLSRIYGDVKTDSLLFAGKIARLSDDSLALANKIDTLSRHLNDTLNNYYTKDSTREVISDTATILRGYISASNTNIHAIRDSLSRIYGDVKADSLLFAGKIERLSDDSLALANKIDTLSRHLNDTLNNYYTKDSTREVISDTATILRGYISASNTNIHAIRDSLSRIYGDVKTDSLLFAGKIERLSDDSLALANKIDTLSRHLNDTLNNYYTKDSTREVISDTATILRGYISASNTNIHAIRDSLSRIYGDVKADSLLFAGKIERLSDDSLALANKIDTLSRHLNDTLNNYYTKDSTREVISDTATILRGYISASNTNIHAIRDSLSRIYGDVKADSLLFAGKIERLSDDSLALANKIDTLSRHLNDTLNNYYTKDSTREVISDTATILRGYISASNTNIHAIRDSLSRIYGDVKADSLLFAGKIERLSDDSLALANKIDTLSRHLNDTLNNYYTKDSTREVISDTATILRGYISASNTNIHAIRDSLSRIYGDVKADSLLFAGKIERLSDDSLALANKIDTLSRHLNDTLNNYYTKDSTREVISDTATILRGYISASNTNIHAIRDSLSRIYGDVKADSLLFAGKIERLSDDSLALANKIDTLSRHLNDTLNNYYTKDSTREVISDTATILRGYISASNTNIHAIRDSLSRIYGDVKTDSLLFAGKIARLSDDSLALAGRINTVETNLSNRVKADSTRLVKLTTRYMTDSAKVRQAISDSLRLHKERQTISFDNSTRMLTITESNSSCHIPNTEIVIPTEYIDQSELNQALSTYWDSTKVKDYVATAETPQVQADWNVTDVSSKAFIQHKPSIIDSSAVKNIIRDSLNQYTTNVLREEIKDTAKVLRTEWHTDIRDSIKSLKDSINALSDSIGKLKSQIAELILQDFKEYNATASQTQFTDLTATPLTTKPILMYINGVLISKNAFTVSETTLTYIPANNGGKTLAAGDRIQIIYYYKQ